MLRLFLTVLALHFSIPVQDPPAAKKAGEPAEVKKARETLEKNADDPKGNMVLGLYLGATLEDWPAAIPFLAKSKDTALTPAVEKEQAGLNKASDLMEAGDLWVAAAKKHAAHRTGLRAHACEFYVKAWDQANDEATRQKLRPKLKILLTMGPPNPLVGKTMPRGWSLFGERSVAGPDSEYARNGRQSMKLLPSKAGQSGVKSDLFPLTPGANIKLFFWVLLEGGKGTPSPGVVVVDFFKDDPRLPIAFKPCEVEFKPDRPFWSRMEMEIDIELFPTAKKACVHVGLNAPDARMFLDDFSVKIEDKEMLANPGFE